MALIFTVILVALVFEFINGFHDTANSIATVVGTKVLSPRQAIVLAAITNLFGALTGTAVASTVGQGLVDTHYVNHATLVCGLMAGIVWNLVTWRLGLPSSSSHALIGGLIGAALVRGGSDPVDWSNLWHKTIVPGFASPIIGFALAGLVMLAILWGFRKVRPAPLNRGFRI